MKEECCLSLSSFILSAVILVAFFFGLSFTFRVIAFLALAPLLIAILYLVGGRGTISWLALVCVIFGPIILFSKVYPWYFRLVVFVAISSLWGIGYKNARNCLLEYLMKGQDKGGRDGSESSEWDGTEAGGV